jgi:hypothetical protein
MKLQSFKYTLSLSALIVCLLLMACGGDNPPEPTSAEQVRALLTASEWRLQTVQVDGIDKTDIYAGLKLQFTANGFTAASGKAIWPASGTWSFTNDAATQLKRNDDVAVDIRSITSSELELELAWSDNTLGSGRVSSIAGKHVFVFTK